MSLSKVKQREIWRKASKKYREKNKDKRKEYQRNNLKRYTGYTKKYAKSNKDKINEKAKRAYKRSPEKAIARANTNHLNEKTGVCMECNKKSLTTEFHHLSYVPNIFIELCKKCHNKRHGRDYYG